MPASRRRGSAPTFAKGILTVTFRRVSDLAYESIAIRPDGIAVRVPGVGSLKRRIPHDLAHFCCERELGLTRGFWGSVAAGALWPRFEILAVKRPPHFRERSGAVIRANSAELTLAEVLTGCLQNAVSRNLDVSTTKALLHDAWSILRPGPPPFGIDVIARACSLLGDQTQLWARVGVDGNLTIRWNHPQ